MLRETDVLLFDVTAHEKLRRIGEKLDVRRRLPMGKYAYCYMRGFYTIKYPLLLCNYSPSSHIYNCYGIQVVFITLPITYKNKKKE